MELGSRETALGPAIRPVVLAEKGVLLLETEPGLPLLVGLHEFGALVAVVILIGGAIAIPALGKDENIGGSEEGVGVGRHGLQVDIRVVAGGLASGGTIEVPGREIGNGVFLSRKCI